jgi:hypothetical protein
MIISHEERTEMRKKDQGLLKEATRNREEIIARKVDKIQKQYEEIEAKIIHLKDQKSKLLSGEITKEEILENAKNILRDERKFFIESLLGAHLKHCQEHNYLPFGRANLHIHMLDPDNCWKLFFFAIDERDIEEAAAGLPDTGMSMKERMTKIEEIDKEISRLSKIIKNDLAALKK